MCVVQGEGAASSGTLTEEEQAGRQPACEGMLVQRREGMAYPNLLWVWHSVCFLEATCPVHVIGPHLDRCTHGQRVFGDISPASALGVLREILATEGIANANEYRTHDLRRGHAQDLVESGGRVGMQRCLLSVRQCVHTAGATLSVILAAGEWKSPAFMAYINHEQLETDAVIAAHVDESDGDE